MSWTTSTTDFRVLLSDGDLDKHRYMHPIFPNPDGTRKRFKTFEYRRVTNFMSANAEGLGLYLNNALLSPSDFEWDNLSTGEFSLVIAPADGDRLESNHFIQWFTDAEIEVFLREAANWLGFAGQYLSLDPGLQPAALSYAASRSYLKLAVRFSQTLSSTFRVEDVPNQEKETALKDYAGMSEVFEKQAVTLRDNFYTRQGQSLAPLSAVNAGNIRSHQTVL